MKLNEWVIFIKESRDWHASKWYWVDNNLIKRYDDDENDSDNDDDSIDKAKVMNFLRHLWDELMRILLILWISAWYCMREIMSDYACYIEKIFIESLKSKLNL